MARWTKILLTAAFIFALVFTAVFSVRAFRRVSRFHAGQPEPIRPWMNVPFVAREYRVPREALYTAIGLAPDSHDRRPIGEIAREQGRLAQEVIADLLQAIAEHRPPEPPEPPEPPPPRDAP
jgi:hypothetical protein